MKVDAKTFQGLVTTLEQRGDIITRTSCARGTTARFYRLVSRSPER